MITTNPCSASDHCNAAYCPATHEGTHADGIDEVCPKIGKPTAERLGRTTNGKPGEVQSLIQVAYQKKVSTSGATK